MRLGNKLNAVLVERMRLLTDGMSMKRGSLNVWKSVQSVMPRSSHAFFENGVTMRDPDSVYLCHDTRFGRDVTLEPHVVFGPGVTVADSVVIHAFSHLEGATLAEGVQIGPYARLRPGTELGADVHVGNFVEIKNSQFGAHSKANHLAYIGDATVGSRVNIGAGTITCNYDGANKHRTIIENDVHIGSNCVLIAPVTLGAGGTVGGGSTISKNTEPGALSVARGKQVSIANWKRPQKTPKAK